MPRRSRPTTTTRSEHWMRIFANSHSHHLNREIVSAFQWTSGQTIDWRSPVLADDYAEYYDDEFLKRLGIAGLTTPLKQFWPAGGPRWDGLARCGDKVILVEAKAYVEECVDYKSGAGATSLSQITGSLQAAKTAYKANPKANWECPFYQHTNRLAHLHYLNKLNDVDAYLVFLYLANAPDVDDPATEDEWKGAIRLMDKALGLGRHPFRSRIADIIIDLANPALKLP